MAGSAFHTSGYTWLPCGIVEDPVLYHSSCFNLHARGKTHFLVMATSQRRPCKGSYRFISLFFIFFIIIFLISYNVHFHRKSPALKY